MPVCGHQSMRPCPRDRPPGGGPRSLERGKVPEADSNPARDPLPPRGDPARAALPEGGIPAETPGQFYPLLLPALARVRVRA